MLPVPRSALPVEAEVQDRLYGSTWDEGQVLLKRAIDVVISSGMLIALSPLLLAIAVVIKGTSKGPAMFVQDRIGHRRGTFRIYKFRTMVTGAEAQLVSSRRLKRQQGPACKLGIDPRITPVGMFLRKTSLDELPQLVNVLLGDMSLVGPRPLQIGDYEGFSNDWHSRRFSVKPGLTCLWQVMGRSKIGFEEWMELDIRYIDQWSVWLDFKILAMTIPAVISGAGAM